jgi:hypothetical protein
MRQWIIPALLEAAKLALFFAAGLAMVAALLARRS